MRGLINAVSWLSHVLKSFSAKYGNPYPKYAKEPENADEILHKQVIDIKKIIEK